MKFTIAAKPFAAALAKVQSIASPRATMPVLANVLLTASALRPVLTLAATDLEVGYQTSIDCEVEVYGSISVPAKKLHEVVKSSPVAEITLELNRDNDRVTVKAGSFVTVLAGIPAEEFPEVRVEPGEGLQLDAAALHQLIAHTDYAQSTDDMRYNLNGTYLRIVEREGEWRLVAAATDGHRMAVDSVPLPGDRGLVPATLAKGLIVCRKGIAELKKLGKSGVLVCNIAGNHLAVSTDDETLTMRLVDGDFPDYGKVVPADFAGHSQVKRAPLADALERVTLLCADKTRSTKLLFQDGDIVLDVQNAELGEACDRVAASLEGESCVRRFNGSFLKQALSAWDCGVVELKLAAEESPLLLTPLGVTEPFAVIMPMRL